MSLPSSTAGSVLPAQLETRKRRLKELERKVKACMSTCMSFSPTPSQLHRHTYTSTQHVRATRKNKSAPSMKSYVFQHQLHAHHEQCASNRKNETELTALAKGKREEERRKKKAHKQQQPSLIKWVLPFSRTRDTAGYSSFTDYASED